MSKIDDIFKKGLDGKGMEYSDGAWVSMEQMLDSKKVGFFTRYKAYVGLFSLLLIGGAVLWCVNLSDEGSRSDIVDTEVPEDANQEILVQDMAIHDSVFEQNIQLDAEATVSNPVKNNSTSYNDLVNKKLGGEGFAEIEKVTPAEGNNKIQLAVNDALKRDRDLANQNKQAGISGIWEFAGESAGGILDKDIQGIELSQVEEVKVESSGVFHSASVPTLTALEIKPFVQNKNVLTFGKLAYLPNPNKKILGLYVSPFGEWMSYEKSVVLPISSSDDQGNLGESTATPTYNYGLLLSAQKGSWRLGAGVGLMCFKEATHYTLEVVHYDYETKLTLTNANYTTTPRGTPVALLSEEKIDSTLVQNQVAACEGCEVSMSYVTVPINLQYNFGQNRLSYFGELGGSASFLQKAKGTYAVLDEQNEVQLLDLATTNQVNKVLWQANASVGARFWVNSRLNVWSSLGYGVGLNSMITSYEQKPTSRQVRLGVEFKLR
ncbi:hypothetical protein N9811_06220 [Bacteroidia bacterium]|nr:hypothetical protein [Bacteroidia bacterium]